MRKIIWPAIILAVFIWFAIAVFWTGTGASKPQETEPAGFVVVPTQTPTPISSPTKTSTMSATPSASVFKY